MRLPYLRILLAALAALVLCGQDLKEFEKNVSEFTLASGMHFIVLERRQAPVVSFHMYVDAGATRDPGGMSGMAHMFEHMIGKGTTTLGTKNWALEEKSLAAVEAAYDKLDNERRKGPRADKAVLSALEADLKKAIESANALVESNAFIRVIEENGAAGFNASTGLDATNYFYSLPSNRLELWFLLQSEWLRRPVFREFYKERDVVREERRMRIESSPQGKLLEALLTTSFTAHPYRNIVGWASDIESLRAKEAAQFHRTYYVPGNITVAIAGDVDRAEIRKLAGKYYGLIPAGPMPPPVITREPKQEGERRVAVESPAQPFLAVAYKRPDQQHADDAAFDVLDAVLSSGRTGIVYKEIVRDKKLALAAQTIGIFPAGKAPALFVFFTVPAAGKTVEENEKTWYEIIDRMKEKPVDEATMKRVKTKVRASLIRQLDSNAGLAAQLAHYHVNYGGWRKLFTGIEDIEKVTAADVQRLARTYFGWENRTVAYTVQPKPEKKGDGK